MSTSRVSAAMVMLVLCALLSAGCATLPESGPVHTAAADRADRPQDAPYFSPNEPVKDASPSAIVNGFMVAMRANPLSTSVARKFLSERARRAWHPNRGTVVYDAAEVQQTRDGANVRLSDIRHLDARGGWRGGSPGRSVTLDTRLVSERGQWRIDNPPDALVVPTSFFDSTFARFNLYFFDQTGRTLLPDPVFIPRGEQTATNLVRGLLSGPGRGLSQVTRSALPSRTDLDLSVVVTESGVAEVPLSREILQVSGNELNRAADQLAWTLRQVPGITGVRITVAGSPVPLRGRQIDVPVTSGEEFAAAGSATAQLWALRDGRVVDVSSADPEPVDSPLGKPGYSMRSLAVSESPHRIAAVSGNGRTVFVASADGESKRVSRPLVAGTDVLRPRYDMFGNLWLVDRTPNGARVFVVDDGRVRRLRIPGVTGADVAAFSVSRDGARLAVAYAGTPTPRLRVVDILRTDEGTVSGAGRSQVFSPGGTDAARVIDIGWRDPATLAVLSRPTAETSKLSFISADGSPTDPTLVEPSVFRGAAAAMVVAPNADLPLHLITPDQRLYTLSSNGNWPRTASKVEAAALVR
jgi:hypothetical protein